MTHHHKSIELPTEPIDTCPKEPDEFYLVSCSGSKRNGGVGYALCRYENGEWHPMYSKGTFYGVTHWHPFHLNHIEHREPKKMCARLMFDNGGVRAVVAVDAFPHHPLSVEFNGDLYVCFSGPYYDYGTERGGYSVGKYMEYRRSNPIGVTDVQDVAWLSDEIDRKKIQQFNA